MKRVKYRHLCFGGITFRSILDEGSSKESRDQAPDVDADAAACPSIIIYMIDPFSYTHNQWPEFSRLAMMGLLRCYQELIANLPEHMQSYVHPQVWHRITTYVILIVVVWLNGIMLFSFSSYTWFGSNKVLCNTYLLLATFQVIPLQTILDFHEHRESQFIKQLCMSVYTQCRRTVPHQILGRSLTGFGPAATAEEILKTDKNLVCAIF